METYEKTMKNERRSDFELHYLSHTSTRHSTHPSTLSLWRYSDPDFLEIRGWRGITPLFPIKKKKDYGLGCTRERDKKKDVQTNRMRGCWRIGQHVDDRTWSRNFLRISLSFLTDVPGDVRLYAWQCSPMQMDTFRRSSIGFRI